MDTNRESSRGEQQQQHASSSTWPNANSSLPPIYSSFGLTDPSSYEQQQQHHVEEFGSLFGVSSDNNDQVMDNYGLSSPFYNSLNFSSDSNTSRIFNNLSDISGNNLIDNLNNQLNTSDSSNIFSGNSSFSSAQTAAVAAPSETPSRHLKFSNQNEAGRTYSSVLHSRLSPFQQQQQGFIYQAGGGGSIGGQQSRFVLPAGNRFDDYLSGTGQQQQQQQRQHAPYQRASRNQHPSDSGPSSSLFQGTSGFSGNRNNSSGNTTNKIFSCGLGSSPGQVASANKRRNKLPFFAGGTSCDGQLAGFKLDTLGTGVINSEESERFSRKVFVGGLPPDIDEEEIKASFRRFGQLVIDWPHKAESKSYFPPKGYAFLLFQEELSVQSLIDSCFQEEDKLYLCVSSPTIKDKPVQIRPWRLNDSDFVLDSTLALDPRKTVFVGGVPRPLKACELANIMNNLYGGVSYAGIDTDPDLKYPKGAGRVAFSNHQSYIAAISARFVHIRHGEIEKRVEVKPYVLDDQFCDECHGTRCNNKFAPFFCANITCLRYYCDNCWSTVHAQAGKEFHKPLVKEGGDRPRGSHQAPLRWRGDS